MRVDIARSFRTHETKVFVVRGARITAEIRGLAGGEFYITNIQSPIEFSQPENFSTLEKAINWCRIHEVRILIEIWNSAKNQVLSKQEKKEV